MCSRKQRHGVNPAAPPTPCFFMIICGLLCSRLVAAMTEHTEDGHRKRYLREWRIYQQYMGDQEKQEEKIKKVSCPNPSRPQRHEILTQDPEIHGPPPRSGQCHQNPEKTSSTPISSHGRKPATSATAVLPTLAQGTAQAAEDMDEGRDGKTQGLRARSQEPAGEVRGAPAGSDIQGGEAQGRARGRLQLDGDYVVRRADGSRGGPGEHVREAAGAREVERACG